MGLPNSVSRFSVSTGMTLFVSCMLLACEREPTLPALKPIALTRVQSSALQQMNEAGRVPFAGWTWRYQFGAACTLRIARSYEGRVKTLTDHSVLNHRVEIVPYATIGFGVKATPLNDKSGSIDLFDAGLQSRAETFSENTRTLIGGCTRLADR